MNLGAGAAVIADRLVDPRPVLIVTGLVQEARIAAGPGMFVICSSSDPRQLRALLATLDPSTFRGVISFGVAGGLDPALKSGDVVVATEVLAGDARWLAGLSLSDDLISSIAVRRRRVVRGGLAGVEQVVAASACKAALRLETGAAAVDMESHIAAAYAAEFELPFVQRAGGVVGVGDADQVGDGGAEDVDGALGVAARAGRVEGLGDLAAVHDHLAAGRAQ